ncbi:MAG: response regulator transcription factor [Dehalococcoidia bacterium]
MSRILLVEDDPAIREAVAYNLEREGYEVLAAADGVTGLRLAREETPDLLVLDLMLPRLSGLDICRVVRSERPVPILVLTARATEDERIEGLDLGADDYVTKPFSMRELMARVRASLRRDELSRRASGAPTRGTLGGGDIELDRGRRTVHRNGTAIELRPKEFDLLEFLMSHEGQALSREQILDAVWGESYAGVTRTVDVHVHALRRKLEDDPAHPAHIVTVRSHGYRFQS